MYLFIAFDFHVCYHDLPEGYHEKPDLTLFGQQTHGKDPNDVGYPPPP